MDIVEIAVGFLIVGGKMLDADTLARAALDTVCKGGGTYACQQRVFGKVLKISSAKGIALDIHGRGQPDIHPQQLHFCCNQLACLIQQLRIPALCQHRRNRQGGTILIPGHAAGQVNRSRVCGDQLAENRVFSWVTEVAAVFLMQNRVDTDPRRAVHHGNGGDALFREQGGGLPGRPGQSFGEGAHHGNGRQINSRRTDAEGGKLPVRQPFNVGSRPLCVVMLDRAERPGVKPQHWKLLREGKIPGRPDFLDALAPQLVFALLKEDAFRQGNHGAGGRCPGIRTAEQTVFALLDQPYRPLFVIDGKQFRIEVQR